MEDNSIQPFQGIAEDVIQHLRFLQTIGVTHLGGASASPRPAPTETVSPVVTETGPAAPNQVQPAPETVAPAPIILQSHEVPSTMPQVSLFDAELPAEPVKPDHSLEDIRLDIGDCQRCKLAPTRTHLVFGDGNPNARLVFVGEAPGADEDASGIPFVGKAGQLLNKIIEAIGMKRDDVFICNVVKCRPPENRTPERDEIAACNGFLHRQLAVIRPKIIVALGAPSAFTLLGDNKIGSITRIRGQFFDYRGTPLMPTFHPAYLLRSPDKKREVWEDMKKVRDFLKQND